MPSVCCAVGCKNNKSQKNGIIFYNIPKDPERRRRWISAIARENWSPNGNTRLCSQHFVSGKKSENQYDPDYVPSLFPCQTSEQQQKIVNSFERFRRQWAKRKRPEYTENVNNNIEHNYCKPPPKTVSKGAITKIFMPK
ncbi:THAP domain-containing protein 11-like [Boleophthalmus pectinirostris]|uniref:THAP domain-containing protein 11-like n=1 Tax=Boleophthalmus pectinirostris TaxID=150288 RepID=UPI000A1C70F3|nr:THAP domain-containing protein 11-like [Boleophthalmus pectinirostris]